MPAPTLHQLWPLVRQVARSMMGKLPPWVRLADLEQAGLIGAWQALQNWSADRAASFGPYARQRIQGAMQDDLRRLGQVSEPLPDDTASPAPGPAELAELAQSKRLLLAAVAQLPQPHRGVIHDALGDVDQTATAHRLGLSPSRVSQLKREALCLLRAHLASAPPAPPGDLSDIVRGNVAALFHPKDAHATLAPFHARRTHRQPNSGPPGH